MRRFPYGVFFVPGVGEGPGTLDGQRSLNATSVPLNAFFEKLDRGLTGIRLYGIAPPKLATDPERLREIAAQQIARLRALAPDGLVVYDIQDEPGRGGQARPFPFLPTVDPEVYAHDSLAELAIPKIVYRCVGAHPREVLSSWLDTIRAAAERRLSVFVGAPRGRSRIPALPLNEAYVLARAAPNLVLGGIAIAERHVAKGDEHQRMLAKQDRRLSLLHYAIGLRCGVHEVVALRLRIVIAGVRSLARPDSAHVLAVRLLAHARVHEVARHLVPAMAGERAAPFSRHAGALHRPVRERIHRRAGLRTRKALANRHQRRERLHSKVRGRGVGGALSEIELTPQRIKATARCRPTRGNSGL